MLIEGVAVSTPVVAKLALRLQQIGEQELASVFGGAVDSGRQELWLSMANRAALRQLLEGDSDEGLRELRAALQRAPGRR